MPDIIEPCCDDGGGGGSASWGSISGTLSDQTDLQTILDTKDEFPDQTGNAGRVLGTDGTSVSWVEGNIYQALLLLGFIP